MLKYLIAKIHLWLGLASGTVVFVVSLTGCIYVFSKEITEWRRAEATYVEQVQPETMLISDLWQTARVAAGGEIPLSWARVSNDPRKSWVFYGYKGNEDGLTYFSAIDYYRSVYVDPYNGQIKAVYDEKADFFNLVKFLHWSLLLKTSLGQPIVGWSTFIFVILLISGLILWWPKSFKSTKNLFAFRWKKTANGYKKLYDLHNVTGFYSLLLALIVALTGMVWAFKWFQAFVYVLAAGTASLPDLQPVKSAPQEIAAVLPVDRALSETRMKYADAGTYQLSLPSDSLGVIQVSVQEKAGRYAKTNQLQFDRYSGQLLNERRHEDKNAGEKLIASNYDIHVGAILGFPGKVLAFLISLVCASLPVTGFLMWLKRRRNRPSLLINK
ncbi:PepSY-associated TM helix domain-containing protein [Gaoshiqia sp. Z1-71]|uniref:PepSY-associated TM helix domain-containing protein n=1 Tax=Gaoshiqia hydrogeniformans TaxID=3290090 RepID=UPI003BF8EB1C